MASLYYHKCQIKKRADIYEKFVYIRPFYKGQLFLINFSKIPGSPKLRIDHEVTRFVDIAIEPTVRILNCR